jgi:dihydroorotate dehydrogenase
MNFLGHKLKGRLIAASCPATENFASIKACADGGAAAVILKSASSTRLGDNKTRRCHFDKTGFWAASGFDREIMPISESAALTQAATRELDIPVIASVTEMTLEPSKWLESCTTLEKAGAGAMQLDFFYLPNLLAEHDFSTKFIKLLKEIKLNCNVHVMPKLNIELPAKFAAHLLKEAGIEYVSLLDSIRSPSPDAAHLGNETPSVFGGFMLPLTRQYTQVLSSAGFSVCAGGGITNGEQAADVIRLGAQTVQLATEVLLNGYARFGEIEREIPTYSVSHNPPLNTLSRKAELDSSRCTGCGKCAVQAFCTIASRLSDNNADCEGCGFCGQICPGGAIQLTPTHGKEVKK